ncbi:MAG: TonB-dependent receptor [Mucilaginibacter polytrichastri]|nr:TonB-dependent receptor [Mucilaginibacter polytrichastri]
MQIRYFLLLGMFLSCGILSHAQNPGSLSGVLKSPSGEPVIASTVKLINTSHVTRTDENGRFRLNKIAPGKYTLQITGVEYKTIQRAVVISEGKETQFDLTAEEAAISMNSVTVVGRTAAQETNRQAFNVTAIDAKQLYNTTLNLASALDRVAGVRVRESGGVGSNFNLSLNGFSGGHVRYFIDGIPMDNFGSSFQINNIPINLADRVEVYKGVVPMWLGSDALGGAVNIVTGNRNKNYVDVSYGYGSFNTHRSVINAAVTSQKGLTFQLNAFQNYSDNNYKVRVDAADINTGQYAPNAILPRFHDTYHNETLIANVGLVDKPFADRMLFGITLGKNYKEIQTGARMVSVFGGWHRRGNIVMPTFKYRKTDLIKGLDLTLNANYNLGSEQNIDTMNVRYDWFGNSKAQGSSGERSRSMYKYRNNNGLATAVANYRIADSHSFAVSNVFNTFNRKGSDVLDPTIAANETPKKTQKNVLGFGYTYDSKDHFSGSVFGKYIYQNNVSGENTNQASTKKMGYGVALSYFLLPGLQLKTSYELTNRMPEAEEIFGDVENQEGNPNLKPEQSNNVNLGLGYGFALQRDHRFQINASGVYRNATNFIYNRLNNNQSRLVADNREGVRTFGIDGDILYSYKRWLSIGATMTYQYLRNMQEFEPGYTGVSPVFRDQMPNIPYLFGNGNVSVSLFNVGAKGNNLNLGYNLFYVHSFYLYWPSRGGDKLNIPQQISHDLNAVYSLKNGRYNVGLECRNLTNAYLYDNFSLQKPGRALYLNLRYYFNKTNI